MEIDRFVEYVQHYDLLHWNYHDPRIIEVKYEELIADESTEFERIFRHYGFSDEAVTRSLQLAETQTFRRASQRSPGQSKLGQHLRSGKPGEWKQFLSPRHLDRIKSDLGELIAIAGYESCP